MAVDNSSVSLTFRYSEIDYVRAMRAHFASILRLWLDICVIVVAAIVAVYLWWSRDLGWLSIVSFAVSGIFAGMLIAAFFVVPRLVFRREPKFRDEYSLTFSGEGIHFKTAHIDSQIQWSIYSRALVDRHSYVLYHGVRSFTVIPKRIFESIEREKAFDKLLSEHVPKIVRKDPPS